MLKVRVHRASDFLDLIWRQMLNTDEEVLPGAHSDELVKLKGGAVRFYDVWIRNTMRNVMTLVSVFITNCQVSEN
jgi:hypothetical protein